MDGKLKPKSGEGRIGCDGTFGGSFGNLGGTCGRPRFGQQKCNKLHFVGTRHCQ